jgi:hypothetical protein
MLRALDGAHVDELPRTALLLASAGADGAPNLALLSRGEVLAVTADTLRVALHAGSRTAANLAGSGRATLLRAEAGAVETIALRTRVLGEAEVDGAPLALFEAAVTEVREHAVPYATVTSGIGFELHDEGAVLARWERTIALLRDLGEPT